MAILNLNLKNNTTMIQDNKKIVGYTKNSKHIYEAGDTFKKPQDNNNTESKEFIYIPIDDQTQKEANEYAHGFVDSVPAFMGYVEGVKVERRKNLTLQSENQRLSTLNDELKKQIERVSFDLQCAATDKLEIEKRNDSLVEALKGIIDNWKERMRGDEEVLKTPLNSDMPPYWSPSASMVSSEFIAKAKQALQQVTKP